MVFLVLSEKGASDYLERKATSANNNNQPPYAVGSKRPGGPVGGPQLKQ